MLVFEDLKKNLKKELNLPEDDDKLARGVRQRRENIANMMFSKPILSHFRIIVIFKLIL